MDPDLRTVRGTLRVEGLDGAEVIAALPHLPGPGDDLVALRTFPESPDRGRAMVEPVAPGLWSFETRLPRRFGDVGATRRGLFANGWWTPAVRVDGRLALARWEVDLTVPDGVIAAVGGAWGLGRVRWAGEGERASLAAVRRPVITPLADQAALLTPGRPRRRLVRELRHALAVAEAPAGGWRGVVAEAPLRRRLARGGVGQAYVSDRAYRLTGPLARYHRVGVARGVLRGLTPVADPFARDLAAAGLVAEYAGALRGPSARRLLGWFSWLPTIDAILFEGTLPFHADVLEAAWPGDPVRDDLVEVFAPHVPGTAAHAQLVDGYGEAAALALGRGLRAGRSPEEAAAASGVPGALLAGWSRAMPAEDYALDVDGEAIRVRRDAPPEAPGEVLVVRVGEAREVVHVGPGPGAWTLPRGGAGSIVLDPGRHTGQADRVGDAWPERFRITATGGVSTINLSDGWVAAGVAVALRRSGDNRNSGYLSLATGRDAWADATLAYTRRFGPPLSGLSRAHRVTLSASTALLNQRFADADDRPIIASGALTWSWTDRQGGLFPMRGWRAFASVGGGAAPGTPDGWISARANLTRLVPLHPRLVVAARLSAAAADSGVRGRLLSLGGPASMRSLPYGAQFGTTRLSAAVEVRGVPIRDASVPLGFGWGSELQLTAGLEAGRIDGPEGTAEVVGLTLGAAGVAETVGADPFLSGVTLAWPVWWRGLAAARGPEVYLRWDQEF